MAEKVSSKRENEEKPAPRVRITAAYSFEDVLRLDQDGYFLIFEMESLELTDEQLQQLRPVTKVAYEVTKSLEGKRDVTTPSALGIAQPDYSSATDKIHGVVVKEGWEFHWARPDRIETWKERGWIYGDDRMVVSCKGAKKVEGHWEIRVNGVVQHVLMVIPVSDRQANLAKRDAEHARIREQRVDAIEEAANKAGLLGKADR